MTQTKVVIGYAAAALVAVLLVLAAANIARAGNYVGTYGGANWDDVVEVDYGWLSTSDNAGFVVGGVFGTEVKSVPGLRFELDLSFRQNEVDLTICHDAFNIDHNTIALLGNVAYDLPIDLAFLHPYVLAGVGYGHSTLTLEDIPLARVEASGVAWQLGGGVTTALAEGVTFGVGYRYFQGPEIEVFGAELSDGSNHSAIAELRFAL